MSLTAPQKNRYLHAINAVACAVLLAGFVAGCDHDGLERVVVSGTVTYQGKPLEEGQIRFQPTANTKAPTSGAFIRKGTYRVDSQGGVPIGTYKVRIEASRVGTERVSSSSEEALSVESTPPREQYIPAKYNRATQLEITIEPGSKAVTRNFELTDQ